MIKIHNVMTNIVGRSKTERLVSADTWKQEILPVLSSFFKSQPRQSHRALIGRWVVEYIGNDPHMYEFFKKNWKKALPKSQPQVRSYVLTGIRDREMMMSLLGLRSESDVAAHLESFLRALQEPKYRSMFRDPKLCEIEKYPYPEQLELALFAPATLYCSHEKSFVSLNTNYYGQLKSKSSLGPLEEYLIREAKVDHNGKIKNPERVWLSMHAGCVEYATDGGVRRGIVIIAPTGTGKSTHSYGLVEAKKQNRLHSDDWVFVNLASREVLISENQFYMRTNIAAIYPHLIPLLVCQPLENVGFTKEMIGLLEQFQSSDDLRRAIEDGRISENRHQELIRQLVQTSAARSLIDPRLMVGRKKFIYKSKLSDLFLFKRDYDSCMILRRLSEDEMIDVLTSPGNVFNYEYGKTDSDGYEIPMKRTTEIYYNPYLCQVEIGGENNKIGKLDQIRIDAYKTLARSRQVKVSWINTRLSTPQTQFCIRRFLEGGIDAIELKKGEGCDPELAERLGLVRKDKPSSAGRRAEDQVGFFDSAGREVEIVGFFEQGKLQDAVAFKKGNLPGPEVLGYSGGNTEKFFNTYEFLGARQLFGTHGKKI